MAEELLPKPQTDLPKPEKDLPLPEKELTSGISDPKPITSSQNSNNNIRPKVSHLLWSFLLGIFFVFLILIIGSSAFLLNNKTKTENKQIKLENVPFSTPTPESIENWDTFDGDEFNFKYPKNSTIEEYSPSTPAPRVILRIPNWSVDLFIHTYKLGQSNISSLSEAVNFEIKSEESNKEFPSKFTRSNYKNGEIVGEQLASESNPNTDRNFIHIYTLFKNQIYHFEFRYSDSVNIDQVQILADQILSTFKFNDSAFSTTPSLKNTPISADLSKFISQLTLAVENNDANAIANLQNTFKVTCDPEIILSPDICNNQPKGTIKYGYSIGKPQGDFDTLERTIYIQNLNQKFEEFGSFSFLQNKENGNEAIVLYKDNKTSSDENKTVLGFYLTKTENGWKITRVASSKFDISKDLITPGAFEL